MSKVQLLWDGRVFPGHKGKEREHTLPRRGGPQGGDMTGQTTAGGDPGQSELASRKSGHLEGDQRNSQGSFRNTGECGIQGPWGKHKSYHRCQT